MILVVLATALTDAVLGMAVVNLPGLGLRFDALLLPDQDILTALYGSRVKVIDSQLYNLSDRILAFYNANPAHPRHSLDWVRQHTVIIHYCGRNKPWKPGYVGVLDVFYRELKEYRRQHPPTEG